MSSSNNWQEYRFDLVTVGWCCGISSTQNPLQGWPRPTRVKLVSLHTASEIRM